MISIKNKHTFDKSPLGDFIAETSLFRIDISMMLKYINSSIQGGYAENGKFLLRLLEAHSGIESPNLETERYLCYLYGGKSLLLSQPEILQYSKKVSVSKPSRSSDILFDDLLNSKLVFEIPINLAKLKKVMTSNVESFNKQYDQYTFISKIDHVQQCFIHYCYFLNSHAEKLKEKTEVIPNFQKLSQEIDMPMAFMLLRRFLPFLYPDSISGLIESDSTGSTLSPMATLHDPATVAAMVDDSAISAENGDTLHEEASSRAAVGEISDDNSPQISTKASLLHEIRESVQFKSWSLLFNLFWGLDLYDIDFSEDSYLAQKKDAKDEKTLERILRELQQHRTHVEKVHEYIRRHQKSLFLKVEGAERKQYFIMFISKCLLPRVILSVADAMFCVKFFFLLHQFQTASFSTIQVFFNWASCSTNILETLTFEEASRMSLFLSHLMIRFENWAADKSLYEKECHNTPGFSKKLVTNIDDIKGISFFDYPSFTDLSLKWRKLTAESVINLLSSPSLVSNGKGMKFLQMMMTTFSFDPNYCSSIQKILERFVKAQDRRAALASSLLVGINKLIPKK